jgi:hypothetical protein
MNGSTIEKRVTKVEEKDEANAELLGAADDETIIVSTVPVRR